MSDPVQCASGWPRMVMCLLTLCARFMRTGGGQKSHQVRPQLGGELGGQRRRAAREHFMGGKQDNQQQDRQLHQRHQWQEGQPVEASSTSPAPSPPWSTCLALNLWLASTTTYLHKHHPAPHSLSYGLIKTRALLHVQFLLAR